ncbi:MAG: hypothetical protein MUD01_24060 [Chloroflexaceae bacterium]|jgi:hypothetical protein|nr:hypothetical protein [Chloroflexaceae bacterium]
MPAIQHLPELIDNLPADLRSAAGRLLFVERTHGRTVPPDAMLPWLVRQFGDVDPVQDQAIVRVLNRWTLDGAVYNPLRALRPLDEQQQHDDADAALEAAIAASAGAHDMFHEPLQHTTTDVFGRIRGRYCVTAANIAKCAGWHGVVIFDQFHPLRFSRPELLDYFDTALRWLAAAHAADGAARFPLIIWNCLWKAGASIVHGHMQMLLSPTLPFSTVERWRQAAATYGERTGHNYHDELAQLHAGLGLALHHVGSVRGYVTLTPTKDRELLLTTPALPWGDGEALPMREALVPLWGATHTALRGLIEGQDVRSFNVAVYLPPFGPPDPEWASMPVCMRVVDRGAPMQRAVNLGAMELFGSSVITADPFEVARLLNNSSR